MQIGLLLGAGASSCMGLPTTKEIMDDVENDLCKNYVYQYLKSQEKFEDLEHLFEFFKLEGKKAPLIDNSDLLENARIPIPDGGITVREYFNTVNALRAKLRGLLVQKYHLRSEDIDKQKLNSVYGSLLNFCFQDTSDLDIFTTNYDNLIEKFCELNTNDYHYVDGFEVDGDNLVFNDSALTKSFEEENRRIVRLYKIHGSVDWGNAIDSGIKPIVRKYYDKDIDGPLIIEPDLTKNPEKGFPINHLYKQFAKKFLKYELCIIIGMSLRDRHINEIILKRIDTGKPTIFVSPSINVDFSKNLHKQKSTDPIFHRAYTSGKLQSHIRLFESKLDGQVLDLISHINKFVDTRKLYSNSEFKEIYEI